MTTQTEKKPYGLLGSLSPEMAKDLGDAFSLQKIHTADSSPGRESGSASRTALRLAGGVMAFLSVTVFAVVLSAAAMYLMQL